MASHHHPYSRNPHCQNPVSTPTTITTTSSCCCNRCCSHHPSPPPPPPQLPADQLLQALASLLQQRQQQQQHSFCCLYPSKLHHTHKKHHQGLHFHQDDRSHQQNQLIISSLLQRIDALESSLLRFSASSVKDGRLGVSYSLRDTAARVIQTHFRAFLARRSRTLTQLKDLALIKSSFTSLKSSVSNKTHFDEVVTRKATDLLIKLDSIQVGDPMIREGKRSISRDLIRFLDFIDDFTVKRNGIVDKAAKNVRCVGSGNKSRILNVNDGYGDMGRKQRDIVGKLRDRVEKISGFSMVCENDGEDVELEGFQQFIDGEDNEEKEEEEQVPKLVSVKAGRGVSKMQKGVLVQKHEGPPRVKKTVTFNKNGNMCRIFDNVYEPVLSRDIRTDGSESQ